MFEGIMNFLKKIIKKEEQTSKSKDAAKERLHLVLMQDRANVSADFLDLMKQEIIEVIKKYIDIDESAMDVRLTNKENTDGTNGAPALYANIPILNIKDEARKNTKVEQQEADKTKQKTKRKNSEQTNNKKEENKAEVKQQENKTEEKEEKQPEEPKEVVQQKEKTEEKKEEPKQEAKAEE